MQLSHTFEVKLQVKLKFLYLLSNLFLCFSVGGFLLFFIIDFPARNSGEMAHIYYEIFPSWIFNFISIAILSFITGILLRRNYREKGLLKIETEAILIQSKHHNQNIKTDKIKSVYVIVTGLIFKRKKIQINTSTNAHFIINPPNESDFEEILNKFIIIIPDKVHPEVLEFGHWD